MLLVHPKGDVYLTPHPSNGWGVVRGYFTNCEVTSPSLDGLICNVHPFWDIHIAFARPGGSDGDMATRHVLDYDGGIILRHMASLRAESGHVLNRT